MASDLVKICKGLSGLSDCKRSCFENLLAAKLLLMFNMCQCLFIIPFMFGSTELYVTGDGIESLRLGLQFFKSNDLSRWSTLSICFLTVDSS